MQELQHWLSLAETITFMNFQLAHASHVGTAPVIHHGALRFNDYALQTAGICRCCTSTLQLLPIVPSHGLDILFGTIYHCTDVLLHITLCSIHCQTVFKCICSDHMCSDFVQSFKSSTSSLLHSYNKYAV